MFQILTSAGVCLKQVITSAKHKLSCSGCFPENNVTHAYFHSVQVGGIATCSNNSLISWGFLPFQHRESIQILSKFIPPTLFTPGSSEVVVIQVPDDQVGDQQLDVTVEGFCGNDLTVTRFFRTGILNDVVLHMTDSRYHQLSVCAHCYLLITRQ